MPRAATAPTPSHPAQARPQETKVAATKLGTRVLQNRQATRPVERRSLFRAVLLVLGAVSILGAAGLSVRPTDSITLAARSVQE